MDASSLTFTLTHRELRTQNVMQCNDRHYHSVGLIRQNHRSGCGFDKPVLGFANRIAGATGMGQFQIDTAMFAKCCFDFCSACNPSQTSVFNHRKIAIRMFRDYPF